MIEVFVKRSKYFLLNSLKQPAAEWTDSIGYIEAKYSVDSLQATNDSAKRGVKLSNDFLGSAKLVLLVISVFEIGLALLTCLVNTYGLGVKLI